MLEPISSFPDTGCLASFQGVVESNKVSLKPPFLQSKHPRLPQLPLTGFALSTIRQHHCPSLDMVQHINVFLEVRGPELDTGLNVRVGYNVR